MNMKSIITLFLYISSTLCLYGQNESLTCPFKIENRKIILEYPENGQTIRLRLSSVETTSVLSAKAADKLNYKYISKGDSFPIFQYRLPIYQFDCKKRIDNFHFISDFSGVEELENVDGVLGSLFLKSNIVNLDLKNKKITISKTLEDNFSGEKVVTLPIQTNFFTGNRIFYTPGKIEYGPQSEAACIVLNVADAPVQVEIRDSLYDKESPSNITILAPEPFQTKIAGSDIRYLKTYLEPDKPIVYLGLDYLKKYKNIIFDYPHNRILLVY